MKIISEVERILLSEFALYKKICELEEKKGEAIIQRNGNLLEKLSMEQEKILSSIIELENQRAKCLEQFKRENHIADSKKEITLADILANVDEISAKRLRKISEDLKELLYKIRAFAQTNEKLARDHIEIFSLLLKEIKSKFSLHTGYNKEAVEHCTIDNPLIINRTA